MTRGIDHMFERMRLCRTRRLAVETLGEAIGFLASLPADALLQALCEAEAIVESFPAEQDIGFRHEAESTASNGIGNE